MLLLKIPVKNRPDFGIQETEVICGFNPDIVSKIIYASQLLEREDVKEAGFSFRYKIETIFVPDEVNQQQYFGPSDDDDEFESFSDDSTTKLPISDECHAVVAIEGFTKIHGVGFFEVMTQGQIEFTISNLYSSIDNSSISLADNIDPSNIWFSDDAFKFKSMRAISVDDFISLFTPVEDYDVEILSE